MRYVCGKKDTLIPLSSILKENELVVIDVEPFINEKQIQLQVQEGPDFKAFCSHLYQETEALTVPRYMQHYENIPPQSYFVLARNETHFTAFFCLSHQGVLASLGGKPSGFYLQLKSSSTSQDNQARSVLVCSQGNNLQTLLERLMKTALEFTGGIGKPLNEKLLAPHWLDYLGWESGLALGKEVSHQAILNSVKSLGEAGYPPHFVLIDEGWQQLVESYNDKKNRPALYSFQADSIRFPKGIKGIVEELHQVGIENVGVWHGMMGYHGGIHPELAKAYQLPSDLEGRHFLGYDLGQAFQFFHDYHHYLREQGITFIKVGQQNEIPSFCTTGLDATLLYQNLQSAIQASSSIQFTCPHFNTECLRNENLFYWGNSRIARTADNMDIDNPIGTMRAIRNHLTNSLWLQHLMQPDFDAWITNSAQSETLAIFHALSGTINVIGDEAGRHNIHLMKKIMLPGGRLFKSDRPLTLCEDSIFINPLEEKKSYKAFTVKGSCGVVAAFNLVAGQRTLHGTVSPSDVLGLDGELFAVLSHHNGFIGVVRKQESVEFTLKPNQSDVFTFAPIKNGVAVLGCYPFFLAPGPIQEINIENDSLHISTVVAAPMIIYCERQILEVRCHGKVIPWEYDEKRNTLSIDVRSHIVDIHSNYSVIFAA